MVRTDATADDSFAAILARSRFGMAIAAMIRIIATTINSSIKEKPFCLRMENCLRPENCLRNSFATRPWGERLLLVVLDHISKSHLVAHSPAPAVQGLPFGA